MSSIPKKRQKPKSKPTSNARSSTSDSSLKSYLLEPPDTLFPPKDEFLRLFAALAITASVAVCCKFLAASLMNHHEKPFCDSGVDPANLISDYCEPCPINGECNQGKLECSRGYRKHGKLCIEDGDINLTAKKLSEEVRYRLCESYAQLLCHGTGRIWVQENDIWNDLDGHKLMDHIGSDSEINNFTKHKAMETIGKVLETRMNPKGVKELKCADSLAERFKPFSCRLRQWIFNNALKILPICALLVGCILLVWKVRQRQHFSCRVEELYQQVCEILEENALMSKGVNGECEPWVVASRLRDHLLSPKERKNPALWKKVEELVQEDSRVDRYPELVKGEGKVVWEWQVEGSLSSERLKKKKSGTMKLKTGEGLAINSGQQHHRFQTVQGLIMPISLVIECVPQAR
ncbi:hypothetical protein UlMin_001397 [Ulmus minor]